MFGKREDADCPFWQGPCRKHACRLYVHVKGKHPQGEEIVDQWGCSFEFMPWLMIENSQMQRQTGAAVESFRNEMMEANERANEGLADMMRISALSKQVLIAKG